MKKVTQSLLNEYESQHKIIKLNSLRLSHARSEENISRKAGSIPAFESWLYCQFSYLERFIEPPPATILSTATENRLILVQLPRLKWALELYTCKENILKSMSGQ